LSAHNHLEIQNEMKQGNEHAGGIAMIIKKL